MTSRMIKMLLIMGVLFAGIFGYKAFMWSMMKKYISAQMTHHPTVSTTVARYETWQPKFQAVGSLRAIQGVEITPEIGGLVKAIFFRPGVAVKKDEALVQLNAETDVAQLKSLEALAKQAELNYKRNKAQYTVHAISQAELEASESDFKSKQAQAEAQAALVKKKTIRAPFAGHLGISQINLGQYMNPGDRVVTLQSLDPIYVDFSLPQKYLSFLKVGQEVLLKTDTYPDQTFKGKITALDPKVDLSTRNFKIQATLSNTQHRLMPGMFGTVDIYQRASEKKLTLPKAAISFHPYGEVIFLVKEAGKDEQGKTVFKVTQTFVTVGESRGDQIAILKGLKEGDVVVSAGHHKLRNNSVVTINNTVQPAHEAHPEMKDR